MHSSNPENSQQTCPDYKIGYRRPPKAGQFKKGQSGNPKGRPKAKPPQIDLASMFDGTHRTRDGQLISKREMLVMRIIKDASDGNQKAFRKFCSLLELSGLRKPPEKIGSQKPIVVRSRPITPEEFIANFGQKKPVDG